MSDVELQFLADESCDFGVVRALRAEGYDVVALTEITTRSLDDEVIAQSFNEDRILLTEDKDFGQLVFASRADSLSRQCEKNFAGNHRQIDSRTGKCNSERFCGGAAWSHSSKTQ